MTAGTGMQYNSHVPPTTGLVGRAAELAQLGAFLDGSSQGALAIRGDAGVGKTALAAELCKRAADDGWRVLRAIGVEAERQFALSGLNQMVFRLRDELATLDARDRDVLAPVFGADPVQTPSTLALALAVLDLLGAAAAERPVVLVVDDVHWLDELSAAVLSAAGRRVSDPRVRIVALYRPHAGVDFSGWAELLVEPLGDAESATIVDRMALPLSPVTRQA